MKRRWWKHSGLKSKPLCNTPEVVIIITTAMGISNMTLLVYLHDKSCNIAHVQQQKALSVTIL
jgi:hypothetical protein